MRGEACCCKIGRNVIYCSSKLVYTTNQKFGGGKIFPILFVKRLLCSTSSLNLFDQNYSKTSTIVKYYYNKNRYYFSILNIKCIPVIVKLNL